MENQIGDLLYGVRMGDLDALRNALVARPGLVRSFFQTREAEGALMMIEAARVG